MKIYNNKDIKIIVFGIGPCPQSGKSSSISSQILPTGEAMGKKPTPKRERKSLYPAQLREPEKT